MAMSTMKFLHGEGKQPQRTRSWSSRRSTSNPNRNNNKTLSSSSVEQLKQRSRCRSLSSNPDELFFSTARMASFIRSNTCYSNSSSNSSICSSVDNDDDDNVVADTNNNKINIINKDSSSTFPEIPKVNATTTRNSTVQLVGRRASATTASMFLSDDDRMNSLRTLNEARTKALLSCSNEQVEVCRAIRRELPPFLWIGEKFEILLSRQEGAQ